MREHPALRYLIKRTQKTIKSYYLEDNNYIGKVRECLDSIDLEKRYSKYDKPQGALIEITNACNLNCLMCNTKFQTRPEGLMSAEVFERIVTELKANGINNAGLHTVGETFLYKDLATLVNIAKKHDFRVWMSTNGQYPERMMRLYQKFPKQITDIRISTDGATQETFEKIRIGGSFDKLMESFEILHSLNSGKKQYRIGLTVDSILNMANIFEIRSYFDIFGKYVSSEDINFNIVNSLNSLKDGIDEDSYISQSFPFTHLINSSVPCHMPFTNSYFTYDGQVTLCCRDYNGEITAGDIMDSTLEQVWNGEQAENIRHQHKNPETLKIDACLKCYSPYRFISTITNYFIHYLYLKIPELSPRKFGEAIYSFLNGMNKCMETKDIDALKIYVMENFSRIKQKDISCLSNHIELQSIA